MLLGMYEGKTIFKNITIKHLGGKMYLALESLNLLVNFFMGVHFTQETRSSQTLPVVSMAS